MLHDIGTHERVHFEMVGAIVHQLLGGAPVEEIKRDGVGSYYGNYDKATYLSIGTGVPFTAAY